LCNNFTVHFTDESEFFPTSWEWTFGDGQTSTEQNPTHTYMSTGVYSVALVATNAYGGNQIFKTDYISME
jgi:PKD repeat protein